MLSSYLLPNSLLQMQLPVTGYEATPILYQQASPRLPRFFHIALGNFPPHICLPSTGALPTQLHEDSL